MNTHEIYTLLEHLPGFIGVFPSDKIPRLRVTHNPRCLISNTDPASKPGTHWIAISIYKKRGKKVLEVFDSYGTTAKTNHGKKWKIIQNDQPLQQTHSKTCGQYCVYFVYKRLTGHSFSEIINYLKKLKDSDKFVSNYVAWLEYNIKRRISSSCKKGQICKTVSPFVSFMKLKIRQ